MVRVAINGYGRIGRCVLRALYETGRSAQFKVVAINEPADRETIAHLTKYDSTHGKFSADVSLGDEQIVINGDPIALSHHQNLDDLPWAQLDIDVVLECTGLYTAPEDLQKHLDHGAKKVLLSQPGDASLKTIVYGVNDDALDKSSDKLVSAASCTSNCIIPVIAVLDSALAIESGVITTIHSAMNDQPVIDAYHNTDLRKTRAAGQSIIPVDTGLSHGVSRILPDMKGKFAASALRVPTTNVSVMELSIVVKQTTSVAAVNEILEAAERTMPTVMGVQREPLASIDYNHDARSGIVDLGQTRVIGNQVNVLTWFDNEWAYANRMLDILELWTQ